MTESKTYTFRTPADSNGTLGKIKKLVTKLNKKAVRYGGKPVTMTIGEPYLHTYKIPDHSDSLESAFASISGVVLTKDYKVMVRDVAIDYEEIKIAGGWRVLASVERMADSEWNIINGKVEGIEDYKKWDLTFCDHCGTKRNRKKVIILEDKDGNRKVVGRQCVKDYLGISIANAIFAADFDSVVAAMFEPVSYHDFDDEFEGERDNSLRAPLLGTNIHALAVITAHIMKKQNWTYKSTKVEEFGQCSTASQVMTLIADARCRITNIADAARAEIESIEESTVEVAEKFLAEAKEQFPEDKIGELDSSFDYDFAIMLAAGHAPKERQFIGMFGYRLSKALAENVAKKHDVKKSEYVGTVGEKLLGMEVEITKTRSVESFYGDSLMVCGFFKDTDNQFVSFLSGKTDWLYNDDDSIKEEVKISATVKAHQDRGYGKQTTLTRTRLAK